MSTLLHTWAQRINALTLRERLFLFLTFASGLLALADQTVISPSLAQESRWRIADQQTAQELDTLRAALAQLNADASNADSGVSRLQQDIARLDARRQALRSQWQPGSTGTGAAVALPQLLDQVLRRHDRVSLLQLASHPPEAADAASGAASTPPTSSLGTVLVVGGRYADLLAFVQELEQRLPALRWGELQLHAGEAQVVLRVQLWLEGAAS